MLLQRRTLTNIERLFLGKQYIPRGFSSSAGCLTAYLPPKARDDGTFKLRLVKREVFKKVTAGEGNTTAGYNTRMKMSHFLLEVSQRVTVQYFPVSYE
jgi:hypothetical protein